jgi:hypothetical protein
VVLVGQDETHNARRGGWGGRGNGNQGQDAAGDAELLDRAPWPPEVDLILSAMEVARSAALSPCDAAAAAAERTGTASAAALAIAPGASTLIGGDFFLHERRNAQRLPYRTRANLKLYADPSDASPAVLYTRDADHRGLGFITPHLLPLGYGGWVSLCAPNGEIVRVECTIYRCRKTVRGWYEGALNFHRDVWQLG